MPKLTPYKLSFDLSFRHVGWSVFTNQGDLLFFGVIEVQKRKAKVGEQSVTTAMEGREISEEIFNLIDKFSPDYIVSEMPAGSQSSEAAALLAMAKGILIGAATAHGLEIHWVLPRRAKKFCLGNSTCEKDEVIEWAKLKFPRPDYPKAKARMEHIADSIAAFITYFQGEAYAKVKLQGR